MPKRIILCSLVVCLLLILSSCSAGAKDTMPLASAKTLAPTATEAQTGTAVSGSGEDTLNTLYSISNSFLNVHYSITVSQAEEYIQLQYKIDKRFESLPTPHQSVMGLEDYAPDLAERYKALIKQKYKSQPVTDKGYELNELNYMCVDLWKMVIKKGSDIKVTSAKTTLRNKDIDSKNNQIDYTVNLLFNKDSYDVTGVMTLVLVDNKWMVDDIYEFSWSPKLSF
jgi:hypothetical protein